MAKDILRHLVIDDWQSEAHNQHKNVAERRYKHLKRNVQNMLNITGAEVSYQLLCLEYVSFVMNQMATKSLSWRTPYVSLIGITPDISVIYRFCFYDKLFSETPIYGESLIQFLLHPMNDWEDLLASQLMLDMV